MRLGLEVRALPDRASLRLFSTESNDLVPVSGAEIKASLERDRAGLRWLARMLRALSRCSGFRSCWATP
ncbi:MAG: hypothetical protein C1943_05690 [Halochromatium sp.]|nr:hypothetical protein [Halochromatium sp.]